MDKFISTKSKKNISFTQSILAKAVAGILIVGSPLAFSNPIISELGAEKIVNDADINMQDSDLFGALSQNKGSKLKLVKGSIKSNVDEISALITKNGGEITAINTIIESLGTNSRAANARGENSIIKLTDTAIKIGGNSSGALLAEAMGKINISGTVIVTDTDNGYAANAVGNKSLIEISGGTITTKGAYNNALLSESGAQIIADGTTIITEGMDSYGLMTNALSTIIAKNTHITTLREGSDGAVAFGKSTIEILGGSITVKGDFSHGLRSEYDGSINVKNAKISTEGVDSDALFIDQSGTITTQNTHIKTSNNRSSGVHTTGENALVQIVGGSIATKGDYSSGLLNEFGGKITLNNTSITTEGKNSHALEIISGATTELKNVIIKTLGSDSYGFFSHDVGLTPQVLTVDNTELVTNSDAIHARASLLNATFNNSTLKPNNKILLNANANSGVLLNFNNSQLVGDIKANSTTTDRSTINFNLNSKSTWTGSASQTDKTSINIKLNNSTWNIDNNTRLNALILEQGSKINFLKNAIDKNFSYKTLNINSLSGNNSTISLNTSLGNDQSPTDKIEVNNTVTGSTNLQINNNGGLGAQTNKGIQIVEIKGTRSNDNAFKLANTVIAGAYQYVLKNDANKSWYLTSSAIPVITPPIATPPVVTPPVVTPPVVTPPVVTPPVVTPPVVTPPVVTPPVVTPPVVTPPVVTPPVVTPPVVTPPVVTPPVVTPPVVTPPVVTPPVVTPPVVTPPVVTPPVVTPPVVTPPVVTPPVVTPPVVTPPVVTPPVVTPPVVTPPVVTPPVVTPPVVTPPVVTPPVVTPPVVTPPVETPPVATPPVVPPTEATPVVPPAEDPAVTNQTPSLPVLPIVQFSSPKMLYRPDAGASIGNQQGILSTLTPGIGSNTSPAIGLGFSGSMRASTRLNIENIEDGEKSGKSTNTYSKSYSAWFFTATNSTKGDLAQGQLNYDVDSTILQAGIGTDFNAGNGLIETGIMASQGQSKTSSTNIRTHATGNGTAKGFSIGVYGTWYMNQASILSPYIDVLITHGWYKNEVTTAGNPAGKYNATVSTISLQGGIPFSLGKDVIFEPQAQITYLKYSADTYIDHSKTRVSNELNGNVIGRVGAYIYLNKKKFKPYLALNAWYDNTNSVVKYNDVPLTSGKKKMILEAKLGFQSEITPNLSLWGDVNVRKGRNNFKDIGGSIGLKYRF